MNRLEIAVTLWPERRGELRQFYDVSLINPHHRDFLHDKLDEMLDELYRELKVA